MTKQVLKLRQWLDRLVTANWWWKLKLKLAERHLAEMLHLHGENSIPTRQALVRYQRVRFAYTYGRPVTPTVKAVIERVRTANEVPLTALWTLVINRDISDSRKGVCVRRAWWAKPLKYGAQATFILNIAYLGIYTLATSASIWVKLLILAVIMAIYLPMYFVWHIYTVRPLAVIERYGDKIDEAARELLLDRAVVEIGDAHHGQNPEGLG